MATSAQLRREILAGQWDEALCTLYGTEPAVLARQRQRYAAALEQFELYYGPGRQVHVYSAPGRAELGGNHTDHQHGEVLATSINLAVRNLGYLKKDGIVIVNRVPVKPVTESLQDTGYDGTEMIAYLQKKCSCIVIDAEKICAPFGSSRYFNIAILGVAVGSGRLGISKETVLAELERRVPSKYVETNKAAFYAGVEVGSGKTL